MEKIVFLDTNVFVGNKFSFLNKSLTKLKKYVENNVVIMLENEITKKEIYKHMYKKVKSIVDDYNKICEENPIIERDELNEKEIEEKYKEKLEEIFINSIKLPLDIDIEEIIDQHFNLIPPFEKEKTKEFKDAFVIQLLKKYKKESKEEIFIVTNDRGFQKAFDNVEGFFIFNGISEFIDKIEMEMLEKNEKYIIESVKNGEFDDKVEDFILENINFDRYSDSSDSTIEDIELERFCYELIEVLENDSIKSFDFNLKLRLKIIFCYLDEDTSYFDREDGEYLFSNYITTREIHDVELSLVINCKTEDIKTKDIEEEFYLDEYIEIDKEKTDKSIYLDEDSFVEEEVINNTYNDF